jgi:hypothetical protein
VSNDAAGVSCVLQVKEHVEGMTRVFHGRGERAKHERGPVVVPNVVPGDAGLRLAVDHVGAHGVARRHRIGPLAPGDDGRVDGLK